MSATKIDLAEALRRLQLHEDLLHDIYTEVFDCDFMELLTMTYCPWLFDGVECVDKTIDSETIHGVTK